MGYLFCCHQSKNRQCGPGTNSGSQFPNLSQLRQCGPGASNWDRNFLNLHLLIIEAIEALFVDQSC